METRIAELNETVKALHQMNKNCAEQAVAGYKRELADALRSIAEDMNLPEVRNDAAIMTALMDDLFDALRYKGIAL